MSDVSNSIRLNDYMSSTLRTINQTMEQTISIMQRLDTQLRTLGTGGSGLSGMDTSLSAVMARVRMLETMIASIGTGAGPGARLFSQLNTQLITAQARITELETQLANLGNHNNGGSGDIERLNNELAEARGRVEQLEREIERLGNQAGNTGRQFGGWALTLTGVFSALQMIQMALMSFKGVTDLADEFTGANARLALINDGLRTQAQLQQQVLETANKTGASYTATAALVARMGRTEMFRGSNDAAIRFADIVNKSLTISGASTSESSSVIIQLSQAMSSGVLRGEEFNAIMENGSRLAEGLATQLGVGVGQLRAMAMNGELTADVVADAIMKAGEAIDAEFEQMPRTFGRNIEIVRNEIGYWLADMAEADGALGKINAQFTRITTWLQDTAGQSFLQDIAYALNVFAVGIEVAIDGLQALGENFEILGPIAETVLIGIIAAGALMAAQAIGKMVVAIGAAAIGFAATHPVITAVAIAIGIVISMAKSLGVTMTDVVVGIIGAWYWLQDAFGLVVLKIKETFTSLATFIDNILVDIMLGVQRFINDFLGGVDALVDAVNKYSPIKLEHTQKLTFATDAAEAQERLNKTRAEKLAQERADLEKEQRERQEKLEEYRLYWAERFGDKKEEEAPKEIPGLDGWTMPNISSVDKVGKVGKIDDDVNIADEDMKLLMDLAIQNRVNQINLTVQTSAPNITQTNTINTEMDLQTAVNDITSAVYEYDQVTVEQDY